MALLWLRVVDATSPLVSDVVGVLVILLGTVIIVSGEVESVNRVNAWYKHARSLVIAEEVW
jgi:drug/metabolite transporter superfamily protein YnfA